MISEFVNSNTIAKREGNILKCITLLSAKVNLPSKDVINLESSLS